MPGPAFFINCGCARSGLRAGRLHRIGLRRFGNTGFWLGRHRCGFSGLHRTGLSRPSLRRFGNPGLVVAVCLARFAVQALQIGAIEVVPAAVAVATPLVGAIAATVVTLAKMRGQRVVVLRQRFEHVFTAGDVGLVDLRADCIDAQRIERVAFRSHQIPAAIAFFRAKETAGLERRAFVPPAELVQRSLFTLGQPRIQLLLLFAGGAFQLFVVADFFRPLAAG